MSDLQQLHTQAKKLILTIRAGLERLESLEHVRPRWGDRLASLLARAPARPPPQRARREAARLCHRAWSQASARSWRCYR